MQHKALPARRMHPVGALRLMGLRGQGPVNELERLISCRRIPICQPLPRPPPRPVMLNVVALLGALVLVVLVVLVGPAILDYLRQKRSA